MIKKKVPQQKSDFMKSESDLTILFLFFEKKKESKQFFADRKNKKKRFTKATRDF